MIDFLLQNVSGITEEYLENMSGSSVFRSRFEPGTPIYKVRQRAMKFDFAPPVASICKCSPRHFETRRMLREITFILWIILGSTDTSPCRSHLSLSVLAVKVASLKTNTKTLGWAEVAQSV